MKTIRIPALLMGLIATFVIVSCKKTKDVDFPASSQSRNTEVTGAYMPGVLLENGSILTGGVTLTAPEQVDVDETFSITATIECGKVSIDRGYILAADNVTKIYSGLTCETANLLWEEAPFECYTDDASWNGSFDEASTYVFRTKHNGNDGNCDGLGGGNTSGLCSFSGNQFYCFVVEAVDGCETSFTGEAFACGTDREAEFTFTSKDAHDYIKIQGGLTNFTGADAEVTITGGTGMEYFQSTPGGSSNRVIRVEGSVGACETIKIRIRWSSTNSGGVITGSWSVKDSNGVELATAVEGLTCD